MKLIYLIIAFIFSNAGFLYADSSSITVHCNQKIGQVNRKVFGNNYLGHLEVYGNPPVKYFGSADYGAGVWDPKQKTSVRQTADSAKQAGAVILRFPGGCGTHHYNWKNAIGKNREHFLYGLDEFLKTCEEIGAEAVITVSYFIGTEQDAADLAEYLFSPYDGSNPNGGIDWAEERSENGHPSPYSNVKYFEIGNEVYHGDHENIKEVFPEEYADRYLKYYKAMKSIDPEINIGVVLCPIYWNDWNRRVLSIVKDKVDFGIIHTYSAPEEELGLMGAKQIFEISLGIPVFEDEAYFQDTLKLLKAESGKDVPLAITEYNGGFAQEEPVPYRHCLGTALINAEFLRIFMKPEHKILMANYWHFCNSYWGMIKSREDFMAHDYSYPIHYIKRPNYYVFELYQKHFGPELIKTDVVCGSYKVKEFSVPYLTVNASVNKGNNKTYLMVVNKNLDKPVCARVYLKDFISSGKGNAWVLNGPSIDATNEKNPNNVRVKRRKFKISENSFEFTFKPHSLTAIEIEGY
jgi:alpha-N-arabinofuranosidase